MGFYLFTLVHGFASLNNSTQLATYALPCIIIHALGVSFSTINLTDFQAERNAENL